MKMRSSFTVLFIFFFAFFTQVTRTAVSSFTSASQFGEPGFRDDV